MNTSARKEDFYSLGDVSLTDSEPGTRTHTCVMELTHGNGRVPVKDATPTGKKHTNSTPTVPDIPDRHLPIGLRKLRGWKVQNEIFSTHRRFHSQNPKIVKREIISIYFIFNRGKRVQYPVLNLRGTSKPISETLSRNALQYSSCLWYDFLYATDDASPETTPWAKNPYPIGQNHDGASNKIDV